jgi:hypothetical protein
VTEQLRLAVLAAYDQLFGLELEHLAVDGCITKAPCGGQTAGPSPVDRRKQGLKRSVAVEAGGIPLAAVAAPANRRDGLLAASLDAVGVVGPLPQRPTVHLDAGYDWQPRRQVLAERGHGGRDRHAWGASTHPGGPPQWSCTVGVKDEPGAAGPQLGPGVSPVRHRGGRPWFRPNVGAARAGP